VRPGRQVEIDEDLSFQSSMWRFQRWGWKFFSLVLVAALAGLFGSGPLASSAISRDSVSVLFDRFQRSTAESSLQIHIAPWPAEGLSVKISRPLADSFTSIVPAPDVVRLSSQEATYAFLPTRQGSEVRFLLRAGSPGWSTHIVKVHDREFRLWILVYP